MIDTATYARARKAGIPAKSALALARAADDPLDWSGDNRHVYAAGPFERDGFRIVCTADYDEDMDLADLGYGTLTADPPGWYNDNPPPAPVPGAVRVLDSRKGGPGWYVPAESLAAIIGYERSHGASRAVALDNARARIEDEAERALDDYGPTVLYVKVAAYRAGVLLASDTVGGIEIGWDDLTRKDGTEYLSEVALDILPGVIDEARATIARLTEGTE